MTNKELEELEKLFNEATEGPWEVEEQDYGDEIWFGGDGEGLIKINGWYSGGCKKYPEQWKQLHNEAQLIAASRTAVPKLIAEVRRLREALEFYADKDNWYGDGPESEERGYYWCNRFMPQEQDYSNQCGTVMVAGDRARQALEGSDDDTARDKEPVND